MTLKPGDEVIAGDDLYGGTRRLFTTHYAPLGIQFHFVDTQDPANVAAKLNDRTRLVWLETPTNPLLRVSDIAAIAGALDGHPARLAVDNTFATPALQNPLKEGADIVMHSVAKYLGGHSDVVMGALMTKDAAVDAELRTLQNNVGAIPGPMDCFLVLQGIKTWASGFASIVPMAAPSPNGSKPIPRWTGCIGWILLLPTTPLPPARYRTSAA